MAIVFNVSLSGFNADTTNQDRLVVSSNSTELKILKKIDGGVLIPSASSEATKKHHHGLGYAPSFLAYFQGPDQSGWWSLPRTRLGSLGNLTLYDTDARVNKELIYLYASRGDSPQTGDRTVKYVAYIMDQPAIMGASGNDKPIGYQDSRQGLIVSQPGFNADEAKIYQQRFNSNADFLKYHLTTTNTLSYDTNSSGTHSKSFTHNLGYAPMFMVYGKFDVEGHYSNLPHGRSPLPLVVSAACNSTNIRVTTAWAGSFAPSTGTFLYRIVIFKNKI